MTTDELPRPKRSRPPKRRPVPSDSPLAEIRQFADSWSNTPVARTALHDHPDLWRAVLRIRTELPRGLGMTAKARAADKQMYALLDRSLGDIHAGRVQRAEDTIYQIVRELLASGRLTNG